MPRPLRVDRSVVDCVGDTPIVQLNRIVEGARARVYAKLEMQNPGGSVKDRIAASMIEEAEQAGQISPGRTTVIEYTSGNTGIGLAMVCAAKGYKCIIVMPQLPPMRERYWVCRKFGAQVHLTAGALGIPGMKRHMEELLQKDPDCWCPRQFENVANPAVHFNTTGPEIWEQMEGDIDVLVAGAGTGGTIVGIGQFLKKKKPSVRIICVEPTESRVLVGKPHHPHTIVGIGAGIQLPFIKDLAPDQDWCEGPRGIIDEFLHCTSAEAMEHSNLLARTEGLLVGPTSGAVCKVALDVARRPEMEGKSIVTLFASSGIRYTTHPMWAHERVEGAEALPANAGDGDSLLRWASP